MKKSDKLLNIVEKSLDELKAVDIRVLDVSALTTITSFMVICTGTSKRHVKALSNNLITEVKKAGAKTYGDEGSEEGEWVLIDLGEIVVHVMQAQARALFQLEKLWAPELGNDRDQAIQ